MIGPNTVPHRYRNQRQHDPFSVFKPQNSRIHIRQYHPVKNPGIATNAKTLAEQRQWHLLYLWGNKEGTVEKTISLLAPYFKKTILDISALPNKSYVTSLYQLYLPQINSYICVANRVHSKEDHGVDGQCPAQPEWFGHLLFPKIRIMKIKTIYTNKSNVAFYLFCLLHFSFLMR